MCCLTEHALLHTTYRRVPKLQCDSCKGSSTASPGWTGLCWTVAAANVSFKHNHTLPQVPMQPLVQQVLHCSYHLLVGWAATLANCYSDSKPITPSKLITPLVLAGQGR